MAELNFSKRDLLMPALLAIFFFIFYLVYEDIKERTIEEFNNEQLILARTASQGMTSFFEEQQSVLTFLAEFQDIIDLNEAGEELLSSFYNTHNKTIEAVTRVDANGIILYTFPYEQAVIGNDISYQNHVKQVIREQKPVISDVFLSAQGYLAIALHVPVFKEEVFAGSLAILIPIDKLGERYLKSIKNRGTGNVWLLSENGIEIYCPSSKHIGKPMLDHMNDDDSSMKLIEKIKEQSSGTVKGIHTELYDPEETKSSGQYITFYRSPLGNTYWTILISYQEKDIYAAIARLRNRLILVFSLLFITITYFFYSLARVSNVLKLEAERKKAEKTLLKSEEKFRRLFEDHLAMKLLIDPNSGVIVDANKSASDYYGWTRDELKGKNISEINLLSPDEINRKIEMVKSQKENKFEFKHRLKNGSLRDVEVLSSVVEIEEQKMLHSIVYDITYRKQVEEALIKSKEKAEESDRLKTAFLQNMSHEIRTPMNAIMGFSSLLADCYNDKTQLEQYSDIILQRSNDLLEIIDDILNISKIESGQLTVNNEVIKLNDFFADLSAYFYGYQKRSGKPEIPFKLEAPDDPSLKAIYTDKFKLRQIFINLLSNAFKFTNTGKIEGGCMFDKNQNIVFYVSDTGIGIPADKQEEIFERFAQLDQRISNKVGGTGLGLSIAKGLVELLNGKIWLESEPGKGTKFYFSFPVDLADAAIPSPVATRQDSSYDFRGKTLLVVEDDSDNYKLISAMLADTGIKITHAKYGKEAVEIALSQAPDLVLMDIRLPDLDGYTATREIKKQKPDLPIIAQTAYAAEDDRRKAFDTGCSDYISKPLKSKLLLDMIKKQLFE